MASSKFSSSDNISKHASANGRFEEVFGRADRDIERRAAHDAMQVRFHTVNELPKGLWYTEEQRKKGAYPRYDSQDSGMNYDLTEVFRYRGRDRFNVPRGETLSKGKLLSTKRNVLLQLQDQRTFGWPANQKDQSSILALQIVTSSQLPLMRLQINLGEKDFVHLDLYAQSLQSSPAAVAFKAFSASTERPNLPNVDVIKSLAEKNDLFCVEFQTNTIGSSASSLTTFFLGSDAALHSLRAIVSGQRPAGVSPKAVDCILALLVQMTNGSPMRVYGSNLPRLERGIGAPICQRKMVFIKSSMYMAALHGNF